MAERSAQHMLEAIARMAEHARLDEQRRALIRHANLIRAAGERDIPEPADQEDMEQSFRRTITACEGAFEGNTGQVAPAEAGRAGR
jgi:protein-tyrosine-phosphatase